MAEPYFTRRRRISQIPTGIYFVEKKTLSFDKGAEFKKFKVKYLPTANVK